MHNFHIITEKVSQMKNLGNLGFFLPGRTIPRLSADPGSVRSVPSG